MSVQVATARAAAPGLVLDPPTMPAIRHVLENMRAGDRAECEARAIDATPAGLERKFYLAIAIATVYHVARPAFGPPVGLLLITPASAGVAEASFVATDGFPAIARMLTRHIARHLRPALLATDLRRLECRALKANSEACGWLEWLGAVKECDVPDGGRNGETFIQYAWRRSDVHVRRG